MVRNQCFEYSVVPTTLNTTVNHRQSVEHATSVNVNTECFIDHEPCEIPTLAGETAPDYEATEAVLKVVEPCMTAVCDDVDDKRGTLDNDCGEELREETLSGTQVLGETGDKWGGSVSALSSYHDLWRATPCTDLRLPWSGLTNGSRPPCINSGRGRCLRP